MPRIVIGARVRVDGKPATVTAHRQKGMVDVRVDGETYDMRKVEATLGRLNPGRTDLYDPDKEQFHAVVQGIYESLMAKHLRVASIHSTRQGVRRADVRALEKGSLAKAKVRSTLGQAHAIATRQGQKYGWLDKGTQDPTPRARGRSRARAMTPKYAAGNQRDYEMTLMMARADQTPRIVKAWRGGGIRFFVKPGGNPDGYATEAGAKGALTRLLQPQGKRQSKPARKAAPRRGNPDMAASRSVARHTLWPDNLARSFTRWAKENVVLDPITEGSFPATVFYQMGKAINRSERVQGVALDTAGSFHALALLFDRRGVFLVQEQQQKKGVLKKAYQVKIDQLAVMAEAARFQAEGARVAREAALAPLVQRRVKSPKLGREVKGMRPSVVGEAGGGLHYEAMQEGKVTARRQRTKGGKGKIKHGIGMVSVEEASSSPRDPQIQRTEKAVTDEGVFTPPEILGLGDYVSLFDLPDIPPSAITWKLYPTGTMMLAYSGYALSTKVPEGKDGDAWQTAKKMGRAVELVAKDMGRPWTGWTDGEGVFNYFTPESFEQGLHSGDIQANYRRLAADIVKHGFQPRDKSLGSVYSPITMAPIRVPVDNVDVWTYAVFGYSQRDEKKVQRAIAETKLLGWPTGETPKAVSKKQLGVWESVKEGVRGTYLPMEGKHIVLKGQFKTKAGKKRDWMVLGPLAEKLGEQAIQGTKREAKALVVTLDNRLKGKSKQQKQGLPGVFMYRVNLKYVTPETEEGYVFANALAMELNLGDKQAPTKIKVPGEAAPPTREAQAYSKDINKALHRKGVEVVLSGFPITRTTEAKRKVLIQKFLVVTNSPEPDLRASMLRPPKGSSIQETLERVRAGQIPYWLGSGGDSGMTYREAQTLYSGLQVKQGKKVTDTDSAIRNAAFAEARAKFIFDALRDGTVPPQMVNEVLKRQAGKAWAARGGGIEAIKAAALEADFLDMPVAIVLGMNAEGRAEIGRQVFKLQGPAANIPLDTPGRESQRRETGGYWDSLKLSMTKLEEGGTLGNEILDGVTYLALRETMVVPAEGGYITALEAIVTQMARYFAHGLRWGISETTGKLGVVYKKPLGVGRIYSEAQKPGVFFGAAFRRMFSTGELTEARTQTQAARESSLRIADLRTLTLTNPRRRRR